MAPSGCKSTPHYQDKTRQDNILKALAGKTWGQKGKDLRNVHVTYTEPVAGYALGAWGPFISNSNMESLERKQRVITGCCRDTKSEHLLAEANLLPISLKVEQEAVLLYERNKRLSSDIPAKITAEATVKRYHLKKKAADGKPIKPPREKAISVLEEMQLQDIQRDHI